MMSRVSEIVEVWGPLRLQELVDAIAPALRVRGRRTHVSIAGAEVATTIVTEDALVVTTYPVDDPREPWEPDWRVSVAGNGTIEARRELMAELCRHLVATTPWAVVANSSDDSTGYVERPPAGWTGWR